MKKIAVILSGCGNLDGSEIYETVITLLALDKAGANYQCLAPDIPQRQVMNYLTGQAESQEKRNVLQESARLARGNIADIKTVRSEDFDALIFPGGFGAAINLSDFALSGAQATLEASVLTFCQTMAKAHKPMGFICIAPTLIPLIFGKEVELTIGNDPQTIATLTAMGAKHKPCSVREFIKDARYKIVSTPAYMLGQSISEVAAGIEGLVREVLRMI
jgi:enhancing lycopene biosynthesis protein 2